MEWDNAPAQASSASQQIGEERAGKESRAEWEQVPRALSAGRPWCQLSSRPYAKAASEEVLQVLTAGHSPSQRVK